MKAAILYEPNTQFKVEEVTIDDPQQGEVLVKLVATGVCHSDLHALQGEMQCPFPIVLGHEGAGIVEKVGHGVTGLTAGDHVVLSALVFCGRCSYCVSGRPRLCSLWGRMAVQGTLPGGVKRLHKDGQDINHFYCQSSFAEYAVVNESAAIKVREDAPLDKIALFACGATTGIGAALNAAKVQAGETVVVYGCGGVGLSTVIGANLSGAFPIVAVDVSDEKLERAKELGATHVINASQEEPVRRVLEFTGGGADHAFYCVGGVDIIPQVLRSTKFGGKCIIVGLPPRGSTVETWRPGDFLMEKVLTGSILGSSRPSIDIPRYVNLFMSGKLPIDKLVTRTYALDQINDAFAALEKGEGVRNVITF